MAGTHSPTVTLAVSTGDPRADETLRGFIAACERAFPGRVRCYPLIGSYVDGSATPESDLDLGVLFKRRLQPGEPERLQQLVAAYQPGSPVRLDVTPFTEEFSLRQATAALKQALVVYGENVVKDARLEPLAKTLRQAIRDAFEHLWLLRQRAEGIVAPLAYPDPDGEFFGYETWGIRRGDETFVPGLRTLVTAATMMATTLLALEAGEHTPSKRASVEFYERLIADEWASYLRAVYDLCKTTCQYQIPSEAAERAQLRELCARMPAFENAFLERIWPQIVASLRGEDALARKLCLQCVQRIAYPGVEVRVALRAVEAEAEQPDEAD